MDTGQHLIPSPAQPVRPRWVLPGVVGILATVAGFGWLGGWVASREAPLHPDEWDPAVAELAAFVEEYRGLEFEHPVWVDFAEEQDFFDDLGVGDLEPDPDFDAAYLGWFRALGLGSGAADLGTEQDTLLTGGVAAYYDTQEDRVVIPAGELTLGQQATIVHELTHALQDQHFDIGRSFKTAERDAAFTAVIEGDATRIENLWIEALPPAELEQLSAEYAESAGEYEASVTGVTSALEALFSAPYQLGPPMAELLYEAGQLDTLLQSPPFTEEAVVDPVNNLIIGEAKRVRPPLPEVEGEYWDEGQIGPLLLFLMLAEAMPLDDALAAVHGWGSDAYVSSFVEDQLCVTVHIEADSQADLDEMRGALEVWATEGSSREVQGEDMVLVRTCDPGPDGDPVELDAVLALDAAASVSWIALAAIEEGLPPEQAHCVGLGTVGAFTLDDMADPMGSWWSDEVWTAYDNSVDECT
ncbi:MAG: hypothetical protein GY745_04560 [Actinomycetia bacterium]|nr:hypothetical protein [Actinomycetes bacterium]MCP4084312.1 hypothetical protein [Actinomycetes bacterium]